MLTEKQLRTFYDDLTKLLIAAEGDNLLEIVDSIIKQNGCLHEAVQQIQETADEEIRIGRADFGSAVWQIEGEARAALEKRKALNCKRQQNHDSRFFTEALEELKNIERGEFSSYEEVFGA
jgi:O6-methylguanine-DNA--protein-cysteine methyltransferase